MQSFLSTCATAALLGVSDARVRQLIAEGKLRAIKVGRAHLITRRNVEKLAELRATQARGNRSVTPPPEAPK